MLATIRVGTVEKRPVYAQAVSDQPWLVVTGIDLDGSNAHVRLSISAVPDRPGETLQAKLTITGNGQQCFLVPLSLRITTPPPKTAPRSVTPPPLPVDPSPRWGVPRAVWLVLPPLGLLILLASGFLIASSLWPAKRARNDSEAMSAPVLTVGEAKKKSASGENHPRGKCRKQPREKDMPLFLAPGDPRPPVSPPVKDVQPQAPEFTAPPPLLVPELVRREVEVVFCIDTTASMDGVLKGAKQKIWAICSQIAGGMPTPDLKVGLVAYRDKGDDYITKVFDLSRDLDSVHSELLTLQAAGGGDTPESVNQGLDDAVNKIKWSTDKKTLRIIFLVGDAPPHMDYTDDVKYPITCKKAIEKGIFINTIQCGRDADCKHYWQDIAGKAEGSYVAIPQTGGVVAVATPFDAPLIKVGADLLRTALIYGDDVQKRKGERMLAAARVLRGPEAADRAAFAAKSKGVSPHDLLDAIHSKRVKLEDVKVEELPDKMKELKTPEERQRFLDDVAARRAALQKEAVELEQKRAEALAAERKKRGAGEKSFDLEVLEILRKQAKKFDIAY